MKLNGLVLGNVGQMVRNGNTLKAMAKLGHFEYPVDDCKQPYVDEKENPRTFTYKGAIYHIEYMSGCFFPFVVKQVNA